MSYDLYLYPREGHNLPRQAVFDYFTGDRYTHDDEIHYANNDTGVYFHLSYNEGGPDADEPNRVERNHVAFNMNYFRPHTFGLEAERVLTPFVRQFDLVVEDGQADGMGNGEYSSEGFLRGWNQGNSFAAHVMRTMGGHDRVLSLPADVNRKLWEWNYVRQVYCNDLFEDEGVDVYVACIWYCREDDQVRTFCLYPNFVPTAVPKVDYVMILRNELVGANKKKSKDTPAWVSWDDLRKAAKGFPVRRTRSTKVLPYLLLHSEEYGNQKGCPKDLAKWIIDLPDWSAKPLQVRPDQVLDTELLAAGEPT